MTDRSRPGLGIDCSDLVELVTDYLEGVLEEPLRAEVEAHLALCDGCEAYLDQLRSTIAVLGYVPVESIRPEARVELMSAFRTVYPQGEPIA